MRQSLRVVCRTRGVLGASLSLWPSNLPAGTAPPNVLVEAWQNTRNGDNIGTLPGGAQAYIHHVWPISTFVKGDRTLELGTTIQLWNGTTGSNDQVGATGPFGDWPAAVNGPKGEWYDDVLPAAFCGMVSLAS